MTADELQYPAYHIGSGEAVPVSAFASALESRTDGTIETVGGLDFRDATRPSYTASERGRELFGRSHQPIPTVVLDDLTVLEESPEQVTGRVGRNAVRCGVFDHVGLGRGLPGPEGVADDLLSGA